MTDPYETPGPTLGFYLRILRRRKWWVMLLIVLGVGASLGYSLTQAKEYSASAQLLVQSVNAEVTPDGTQPISQTDVLTELQLVTSAPVRTAVTRKLGKVYNVTAAEIGQTDVMSVTATAAKPAGAALIANAYATAFVNYQRSVTIANLTAAETQLTQQIASTAAQAKALQANAASAAEVSALLTEEAALKVQLAQLQVNGAVVTTAGVQVVTPASAPSSPSSPKPVRDAILGFVLGLLLGIGLAFVAEHLDDTVYLKEEVERLTPGSPVLALVPTVDTWKNKDQAFVVTATEPNSVAGEAYRSLRTSLQFAALDADARLILVTSPSEDEGKSATVANLGVVMATGGERVAIVSCDLRRPRLGQFFGLDESIGMTTMLLGQCTLEEALQPVPGIDGLSMLASGERPSDPTALLGSHQLAGVLDRLSKMFDLVVVDSPPLLPITDAAILAQVVDATLLVLHAGQTRAKDLRRATEVLSLVRATTIGVVLNGVTKSTGYAKPYTYGTYTYTQAVTNGNGSKPIGVELVRPRHQKSGGVTT
jgi:capsular exopolysaccharide synthesis family protein